jgi:hypothetical protein
MKVGLKTKIEIVTLFRVVVVVVVVVAVVLNFKLSQQEEAKWQLKKAKTKS